MRPILVVDDDRQMRGALREAISRLGYKAVVAENGLEALGHSSNTDFAMVITDMRMPGMDGMELLRHLRRKSAQMPVLVITGYGTVQNAVDAMKEGACDYLMKPFSFDSLTMKIHTMMQRFGGEGEVVVLSPRMRRVMKLAQSVASSDTTVLITGESGTGKEVVARHIHRLSARHNKPFVAINCAAIPESLMESELFGHEKGAFTGAAKARAGKFELASGGTLLLDEIGEMPLALQVKLLRALQEREIDRVGSSRSIAVDIRVIATTNRDLKADAMGGRFREDLYYRISVFPLYVPPLRERPEDVKALAEHFLKNFAAALGKQARGFQNEALQLLLGKRWSGNVRELENAVQRAVLLSSTEMIEAGDFMMDEAASPPESVSHEGGLRDMERTLILKTLMEVGGNKTLAAKRLGVSSRTIRNKLGEYGEKLEYGKSFPA